VAKLVIFITKVTVVSFWLIELFLIIKWVFTILLTLSQCRLLLFFWFINSNTN